MRATYALLTLGWQHGWWRWRCSFCCADRHSSNRRLFAPTRKQLERKKKHQKRVKRFIRQGKREKRASTSLVLLSVEHDDAGPRVNCTRFYFSYSLWLQASEQKKNHSCVHDKNIFDHQISASCCPRFPAHSRLRLPFFSAQFSIW